MFHSCLNLRLWADCGRVLIRILGDVSISFECLLCWETDSVGVQIFAWGVFRVVQFAMLGDRWCKCSICA